MSSWKNISILDAFLVKLTVILLDIVSLLLVFYNYADGVSRKTLITFRQTLITTFSTHTGSDLYNDSIMVLMQGQRFSNKLCKHNFEV